MCKRLLQPWEEYRYHHHHHHHHHKSHNIWVTNSILSSLILRATELARESSGTPASDPIFSLGRAHADNQQRLESHMVQMMVQENIYPFHEVVPNS
jgi:hypothetical protein